MRQKIIGMLPVLSVVILAALASREAHLARMGLSMLTLAILIGMLVGNTLYPRISAHCHEGVVFRKGQLLRLGIILYGFRLTLAQVAAVGMNSILADAIMLTTTFLLTCWIGIRWLNIERHTVWLMGAGSGICGAAAIIATAPVVRAESHNVIVAVATIVIYGTVGIFLYPYMHTAQWWPIADAPFGIYIGSSVHEVAQVVAAGKAINDTVANLAVTTKMIRVMMLAPFLLVLSYGMSRYAHHDSASRRIVIPWFALAFIGVMLINSLIHLPPAVLDTITTLDNWLLAMAMAALGMTTHHSTLRQAGIKPLILGAIILIWLVVAGGALQTWLAG